MAKWCLLAGVTVTGFVMGSAGAAEKLELEKAIPIEGSEVLQPSGLALHEGVLYLVSAKEDRIIYKLNLAADKAAFEPAVNIKPPSGSEGSDKRLILRAVATDPDGIFFVLSESACRILRVKKNGSSEWTGPSLLEAGVEKDLFAGDNAGADGIAIMGPGRFYVGASRQPRGILRIDLTGEKPKLAAFKMEKTALPMKPGHKPDLVDLAVGDKTVFGLMGSADAVCQIKAGETYDEGPCWTYAAVTGDPKYRYQAFKSGLGRGLAVDAKSVYVVVDNKGMPRESDPKDRRALLFVFKRPAN